MVTYISVDFMYFKCDIKTDFPKLGQLYNLSLKCFQSYHKLNFSMESKKILESCLNQLMALAKHRLRLKV